jgi:8-amino-7-oxononanoate synthase
MLRNTNKLTLNTRHFHAKCARFQDFADNFLAHLKDKNPYMRVIDPTASPIVSKNGKSLIMLGSNNYLGLSTHPIVKNEVKKIIDRYGTGCCSSRIFAGTTTLHLQLEEELADFKGTEAALLFSTGYMTMMGTITALMGKNDVVFSDQLNHASIIDGIRLARTQSRVYKHNDMSSLEEQLKASPSGVDKLIVTDGVFSMKGSIANLPGIKQLAKKYNAAVMVDDAHGTGVMGKNGGGTIDHFNMKNQIDLSCCTFSKVFSSVGGAVCASRELIEFIRFNSRPYLFTASLPPAVVMAVLASLRVLRSTPELLTQLWKNVKFLRENLQNLGFSVEHTHTPIIPLLIGNDQKAFQMSVELEEEGVFVNPVIPPGVSAESSLIRISAMASLTREDLNCALDKFQLVGKRLGLI